MSENSIERVRRQYECAHEDQVVTRRIIRNGSEQFVMQCRRCGEKCSNPIKREVAVKDGSVPDFDEVLLERYRKERSDAIKRADESESSEWWDWYTEYLDSTEWREKRKQVLRRAQYLCEGCRSAEATQVHHLTYRHVGDELLFELVAVCEGCHERCHRDRG